MAIDTTLVSLGILPPTIKTTPNSPMVWAKVSTIPVRMAFFIFGINTLMSVSVLLFPNKREASISDFESNLNPFCMG
ncbi:hypothetical protein D3C86_2157410 [compost metagenome]